METAKKSVATEKEKKEEVDFFDYFIQRYFDYFIINFFKIF